MSEPRIEDRPIAPDAGGAGGRRSCARPKSWSPGRERRGDRRFSRPRLHHTAAPPVDRRPAGLCIGQVSLIAIWAVLAPGNLVVRLPWAILLSTATWYALVLGNRAATSRFIAPDAIFLGAVVFSSVAAAQVPLWIAKKAFGWRLIHEADDLVPSPHGPWQFNIRHLLLATFLLAVALSPLRQVLPPGPIHRFPSGGKVFVAVAGILLCNLSVTLPCIWCLMSRRSGVLLAPGWLLYCVGLTGLEIGAFIAIFGAGTAHARRSGFFSC